MGTWIEMLQGRSVYTPTRGRSLQWERGLKCTLIVVVEEYERSFPAMGTWIEIPNIICCAHNIASRSLQWERGLKYNIH